MLTQILKDGGDVALWASAIGILIWVIQYTILAKWWKNFIGITLVGEALCILAIYIPSLMALADPTDFASFAQTSWYLYLGFGIVTATALFIITRIITWEYVRRQRGRAKLQAEEQAVELSAVNYADGP